MRMKNVISEILNKKPSLTIGKKTHKDDDYRSKKRDNSMINGKKSNSSSIQALALIAFLVLSIPIFSIAMTITTAYAQDEEDGDSEVSGGIFANEAEEEEETAAPEEEPATTTRGEPLGYQEVNNTEVIDNNQNVINPGGAGNENINLADDEITTPNTNLAETVLPQSVNTQNNQNMQLKLQAIGYSIADMQPTLEYGTSWPIIIVRGTQGVMTQPNMMDLETVGAEFGYTVSTHIPIDGAWETTFRSVTGSLATGN